MEAAVIRGATPSWLIGSGSGYGSGYGDGDGDGYGYGYGSGSGYGDGSGDGSGDGDGYGSGDGDGYGSGDGSGDGYGDGYGDGDGDGYGSGDGSGDGYGDGYGYGYGYGDGSYWAGTITHFAKVWSKSQQDRLTALKQAGAKLCFWKSRSDGSPANGGNCAPVGVGTVHEEPGPLRDECGKGQLHATLLPASKWEGERWWVVALIGEWRGDDEKMWALKREIIGEVP